MRKIFWLIIILNFILLIPRFKANLPVLKSQLAGDLRAVNPEELNELLNAFGWLKVQKEKGVIPDDAVVVYNRPQWCYYYSGFRSINFPFTDKAGVVFTSIIKADLIITENHQYLPQAFLNPILQDSSKYFLPLYVVGKQPPILVILAVNKDEVAKLADKKP